MNRRQLIIGIILTFIIFPNLTSLQLPTNSKQEMATTTSNALSSAIVASIAVRPKKRVSPKVKFLPGLNSYQGLITHNSMITLGVPISTEQCFTKFANSVRAKSSSKKGSALSSTCNAAFEIFKIASIMNGLVLVGVEIGFILLRIEASIEKAEAE